MILCNPDLHSNVQRWSLFNTNIKTTIIQKEKNLSFLSLLLASFELSVSNKVNLNYHDIQLFYFILTLDRVIKRYRLK